MNKLGSDLLYMQVADAREFKRCRNPSPDYSLIFTILTLFFSLHHVPRFLCRWPHFLFRPRVTSVTQYGSISGE